MRAKTSANEVAVAASLPTLFKSDSAFRLRTLSATGSETAPNRASRNPAPDPRKKLRVLSCGKDQVLALVQGLELEKAAIAPDNWAYHDLAV